MNIDSTPKGVNVIGFLIAEIRYKRREVNNGVMTAGRKGNRNFITDISNRKRFAKGVIRELDRSAC